MTMRPFGRIVGSHMAMLRLVGYEIEYRGNPRSVIRQSAKEARVRAVQRGHQELVEMTGEDFGYDVARRCEFLLDHHEECSYRHRYAFQSVDRAVRAVIEDSGFQSFLADMEKLEPE